MKVIIIGAGLRGLSTAIALRKLIPASQPLEVKIYDNINPSTGQATEQTTTPQIRTSRLGAELGLQADGLRVLEDLDPVLRRNVYATGFPCTRFTWKTASDWLLSVYEILPPGSVIRKKVQRVVTRQGRKPVVQFEGGSPDEIADLVVGADRIRSTVRHDLFGDDKKYRPRYV
ncbi:FAD/NAD(P)-binding domain-containing protein [Daldinia sp. FL1419]|nr:FAD/NAD(P)-binding domain-containing protein [Daldinia sp. FL1419]